MCLGARLQLGMLHALGGALSVHGVPYIVAHCLMSGLWWLQGHDDPLSADRHLLHTTGGQNRITRPQASAMKLSATCQWPTNKANKATLCVMYTIH